MIGNTKLFLFVVVCLSVVFEYVFILATFKAHAHVYISLIITFCGVPRDRRTNVFCFFVFFFGFCGCSLCILCIACDFWGNIIRKLQLNQICGKMKSNHIKLKMNFWKIKSK